MIVRTYHIFPIHFGKTFPNKQTKTIIRFVRPKLFRPGAFAAATTATTATIDDNMLPRSRAPFVRVSWLFGAFCLGCLITYALRSHETRPWCQPLAITSSGGSRYRDDGPAADTSANNAKTLLLVLILSAPDNLSRRNTIRQSWLPLAEQIEDPIDEATLADAITVPQFNQHGFVTSESADEQAVNLRRQRAALPPLRRMRRIENFANVGVRHLFVVGTAGLSRVQTNLLAHENRESGGDMLLLGNLVDGYANLTQKLLFAFDAVVFGGSNSRQAEATKSAASLSFRYVLKCDDDTYVKLDRVVAELLVYDRLLGERYGHSEATVRPELYWGYFSGNAHVKRSGKWREPNYTLGDRYHPYALGGGYVVSAGIVRWVATNAALLSQFGSEDVAMGLWLSALRTVYRRHDVRFDTAWMQRQCRDYHLVLHKRSERDMKMVRGGGLCSGVEDDGPKVPQRPVEYFYDWLAPVAKCCVRRVAQEET